MKFSDALITEPSCPTMTPGQYRGPIVPNSLPPLVLRTIIDSSVCASPVILLVLNDLFELVGNASRGRYQCCIRRYLQTDLLQLQPFRLLPRTENQNWTELNRTEQRCERELNRANGVSRLLLYPLRGDLLYPLGCQDVGVSGVYWPCWPIPWINSTITTLFGLSCYSPLTFL